LEILSFAERKFPSYLLQEFIFGIVGVANIFAASACQKND
jgi:hypothetical protein